MSFTEKWVAGTVGLTWASIMTTELNSIANANAILGSTNLDNSANLDLFADFSLHLASLAGASPNYVGLFLYPLNDDGSTYGDGRFSSSAAGPPPSSYWVGNFGLVAATQAQNGTVRGVLLPPGQFKPVIYNQAGAAFAASANTLKWRTYNRQLA